MGKYTVTATYKVGGDTAKVECQAFSWHRSREMLSLIDENASVTAPTLYLTAFSCVEIRQGDRLHWIWDGEVAKYV